MNNNYDTTLECFDWRYSATIVGLKKYFDFSNDIYSKLEYYEDEDSISYNKEYINEDRYLAFVESYYEEHMPHKLIENILNSTDIFTEDQIKLTNTNLQSKSILKKIFKGIKFDGYNKEDILNLIRNNRNEIIKVTYKYVDYKKYVGYNKYCRDSALLSYDKNKTCRVKGYWIDEGKKINSTCYNFNKNTLTNNDMIEYDFIPFSFSKTPISIFINNNFNIKELYKTNLKLNLLLNKYKEEKDIRYDKLILLAIQECSEYLDYDIEIIVKNSDNEYYETLYLRKNNVDILKSLQGINLINRNIKITEKYWINLQEEVLKCILNNVSLDNYIEILLKQKDVSYIQTIHKLIEINYKIKRLDKGDNKMKTSVYIAKKCAETINKTIDEKNIYKYKQKLTNSIVSKDYDNFSKILLHLSGFSKVSIPFAYDLFEDFDKNKDIAYSFVATLGTNNNYNNEKENNNQ